MNLNHKLNRNKNELTIKSFGNNNLDITAGEYFI